jgi:uncharacterized protein YndB with AHSA1/START domain
MPTTENKSITVTTTILLPVDKVWSYWTLPEHITHWNNASEEWHTPWAENDLRVGGKFLYRMEAKDGSAGFDFRGEYSGIVPMREISYTIEDGRRVWITFEPAGENTIVKEVFEAEGIHSKELQKAGWQAILDNFKRYAEQTARFQRLQFEIPIHCDPVKVYDIMLSKEHYTDWCASFDPTSRFEGTWQKGTRILFTGTGKDGEIVGMSSIIRENIRGKFVSIEHTGIIRQGHEISNGEEYEQWAGAIENYAFSETNGITLLTVSTDSIPEFVDFFNITWPKALARLKQICENDDAVKKDEWQYTQ